jgi:hypothetical protein
MVTRTGSNIRSENAFKQRWSYHSRVGDLDRCLDLHSDRACDDESEESHRLSTRGIQKEHARLTRSCQLARQDAECHWQDRFPIEAVHSLLSFRLSWNDELHARSFLRVYLA